MRIKTNKAVAAVLICICLVGGLYQGMLMPLLSILLEEKGVSAAMNGLNAASLYLGILAAAPFMERALYRFGFKPILIFGAICLALQLALFPVVQNYQAWMGLRFSMGMVNHTVFYTILIWLGIIASEGKRGRYLSYFGFAFGIGFALGPQVAKLKAIAIGVPFFLVSFFSLVTAVLVMGIKKVPQASTDRETARSSQTRRVKKVLQLAWFALLMPLGYGFMEGGIGAGLPIFLTRSGVRPADIAMILSGFFMFGLVTQLPLGHLSDRLGRKKTFTIILIAGLSAFFGASMMSLQDVRLTLFFYILAGGALGSTYSLGVAYVADCIPVSLLPSGNMLCSVAFGMGSLLGPFIGGIFIDLLPGINFSWLFVVIFSFILLGIRIGTPVFTLNTD